MSGKRYPEAFKIEAVKQVVDNGHSVSRLALPPRYPHPQFHAGIKASGPDSFCDNEQSEYKLIILNRMHETRVCRTGKKFEGIKRFNKKVFNKKDQKNKGVTLSAIL